MASEWWGEGLAVLFPLSWFLSVDEHVAHDYQVQAHHRNLLAEKIFFKIFNYIF